MVWLSSSLCCLLIDTIDQWQCIFLINSGRLHYGLACFHHLSSSCAITYISLSVQSLLCIDTKVSMSWLYSTWWHDLQCKQMPALFIKCRPHSGHNCLISSVCLSHHWSFEVESPLLVEEVPPQLLLGSKEGVARHCEHSVQADPFNGNCFLHLWQGYT